MVEKEEILKWKKIFFVEGVVVVGCSLRPLQFLATLYKTKY